MAVLRGVFPVVIPDNMGSIVVKAENCAPRFNDVFFEYAQSRGFSIDAARVATPTDKPRVERVVPYVRNNFFAGETFTGLADCRARAQRWCTETAGMRVHGTTQCRPIEAFRTEELPRLLCLPGAPFDVPRWSEPKVHRDFHVEVDKALYSAPHHLIGRRLKARRDSTTVKLYFRGELVKVHPRKAAGQRSTDPADFPTGKEIYATRDVDRLRRMAGDHGDAIGLYATALLDTPLPWTKMRQVYRLLGLVKKWGPARRAGLPTGARRRSRRRQPGQPHARARPRRHRARCPPGPGRHPGPLRSRPRPSSPPPSRPADERARAQRRSRAQSADAPIEARPAARHPARASCAGPQPRPHPRPVPRAAVLRRGAAPRHRLGRSCEPGPPNSTRR